LGIGWCCFEFGTYALGWLDTAYGLFLLHLVPLPRSALHVALALHWFGSSIQQFTKPGMLSLGHAGVGKASLALVVLCQCGIGLGSVALRFALLPCDGWAR
jgi:hypothetical protein